MLRGETQFNPVSRFVTEIPSEYVEGYIPKRRKPSYDDYDEGYSRKSYSYQTIEKNPVRRADEKVTPVKAVFSKDSFASLGIRKGVGTSAAPAEIDYGIGDRVRHFKFGAGTVTNIVKEPRDYKVTVDFEAHGTKVMSASFAKLVKE